MMNIRGSPRYPNVLVYYAKLMKPPTNNNVQDVTLKKPEVIQPCASLIQTSQSLCTIARVWPYKTKQFLMANLVIE